MMLYQFYCPAQTQLIGEMRAALVFGSTYNFIRYFNVVNTDCIKDDKQYPCIFANSYKMEFFNEGILDYNTKI